VESEAGQKMLNAGPATAGHRWRSASRGLTRTMAVIAVAGAAAALAGCAVAAHASPSVQLSTAFVPVPRTPGTTVAYVVIRNNGPADRLVSARTSVGGRVTFRRAAGRAASAMATIASIRVPAHSTLAMAPNSIHMLITGAGRMRGGKDIILTLVFARAGPVSVVAQVTNPQSGGSSYFLN
jgi:copper(I)-binding protein